MPRSYGRTKKRAVTRANEALELWLWGPASYSDIAKALGISRTRAQHLVEAAMARAARENERLRRAALAQEIQHVQLVLEESYEVATRECPRCYGHGTRNSRKCTHCGGTGYWHTASERGRFLDRILRASEQRAKLLGLYVQQHQLLDEHGQPAAWQRALAELSPDELAEQVRYYLAGVDDGRGMPTAAVEEGTVATTDNP